MLAFRARITMRSTEMLCRVMVKRMAFACMLIVEDCDGIYLRVDINQLELKIV